MSPRRPLRRRGSRSPSIRLRGRPSRRRERLEFVVPIPRRLLAEIGSPDLRNLHPMGDPASLLSFIGWRDGRVFEKDAVARSVELDLESDADHLVVLR